MIETYMKAGLFLGAGLVTLFWLRQVSRNKSENSEPEIDGYETSDDRDEIWIGSKVVNPMYFRELKWLKK